MIAGEWNYEIWTSHSGYNVGIFFLQPFTFLLATSSAGFCRKFHWFPPLRFYSGIFCIVTCHVAGNKKNTHVRIWDTANFNKKVTFLVILCSSCFNLKFCKILVVKLYYSPQYINFSVFISFISCLYILWDDKNQGKSISNTLAFSVSQIMHFDNSQNNIGWKKRAHLQEFGIIHSLKLKF